jgi:SPP1 family predicted phage head-tail adaptor
MSGTLIVDKPFALDKRVTLQAKSATRDELNKPVDAWVNVVAGDGRTWARIRDVSGRQFVAAGGTQNAVQTEITLRRRADVQPLPSMRVVHGSVAYDIVAVLEPDRHWITLMCTKGLSNG